MHNKTVGARGEEIAVAYLRGKSYTIIERNYRCTLGELDIIARDGATLVFVEVKTRRSNDYGPPQLAVTARKQRQISLVALMYLSEKGLHGVASRFDVLAIVCTDHHVPYIDHIKNAFELAH